ncbi:MAG: DUF6691 family protein [Myxococcota bacterium]
MNLKEHVSALLIGLLFSLGLGISGMTLPEKVLGFLDVAGDWDPSLAFVMGGAVLVYFFGYRWVTRHDKPVFGVKFRLPKKTQITPELIAGAIFFGVGWGISGFCPGPALVSLSSGSSGVFLFVASMLGGMYLFKLFDDWLLRATDEVSPEDADDRVCAE